MPIYTQMLLDCSDAALVGGKAVNLGRLMRAGFPVPGGFVITTRAYGHAKSWAKSGTKTESAPLEEASLPDEIAEEICAAYRAMGAGPVAVRSSATAEDLATASMAGQYETFLDIEGEDDLLKAVNRCWQSLDAPRIRAYLREHKIDPANVAMAVVVQRLVSADIAGVLFTDNPAADRRENPASREMLLEASWGLGESVVSGRVQPDVLRLEYGTGRVIASVIADKRTLLAAGSHEERPVEESRRKEACLSDRDIHALWELARRVETHFASPQDMEWAISAGDLYLLQSRPITTQPEIQSEEETLRATRTRLQSELAAKRGPWVIHNLAETLPHPTPLSWSIIQRFMSGAGGFGAMYKQIGFAPSPAMEREGFLELIVGRIYMDAARAPEMFFENFPYAYDLGELRHNPEASQSPPTLPRGTLKSRLAAGRRLAAVSARLRDLSATFDQELHETIFPRIADHAARARQKDLSALSTEELCSHWQEQEQQILGVFAPQTLIPSLIASMALVELQALLQEHFWEEDAAALAQQISSGGISSRTFIADVELFEVARGERSLEKWLADHGHRAAGEFDLASPRGRENPAAVRDMASHLARGESPLKRHRANASAIQQKLERLRGRLPREDGLKFDRHVNLARRYMTFREDGKDFFMLAYAQLRELALEFARRLNIDDDIFLLTREEMFAALRAGEAPKQLLDDRKRIRRAEARLTLPRVIDAANIEALGAPPAPLAQSAGGHAAFAISAGQATGGARIVKSPETAGDLGKGYILICPSTDPSWTPLFVNAAGLILECGGALSHGAVVAREMGLPAVVLPDATRLFTEGETVHVDGHRGWAGRPGERIAVADQPTDPADTRIPPELVPPIPGRKDLQSARIRNVFALAWMLFLLAFFLLPQTWVYQPTLAILDGVLWPISRSFGKPAVVVIVAAAIAIATLLLQKLLTDNRRLLEAKRRAAALTKLARQLPLDSARRRALSRLAATVQLRTLMAAMVPVGILLGPMVMPFVWFKERLDPAVQNAAAGSPVQIVATIDSDYRDLVRIILPPTISLDNSSSASRTLPPLRPTLEHLLALYRRPQNASAEPWELQIAPDLGREQAADDLQAYLARGIPPRGITWQVRPPENFDGTFPVTVQTGANMLATLHVVVGETFAPAPASVAGPKNSPIKTLRVVYPRPSVEPIFFRPLNFLAAFPKIPLVTRLAAIDIGWLWLYLLAYLPILLLTRAILKVA